MIFNQFFVSHLLVPSLICAYFISLIRAHILPILSVSAQLAIILLALIVRVFAAQRCDSIL